MDLDEKFNLMDLLGETEPELIDIFQTKVV